jgi:hypothetical protein
MAVLDRCRGLTGAFDIEIEAGDPGPGIGETQSKGPPNPPGGSGDDRYPIYQRLPGH